ncbi:zinc-dependent metalloprotease [Flavobacterium croceum]|uniref:zinc-dependent metalloprotease n=1 Tax=Flavobacterium croceum TaxID=370975 RepID=UPI0024A953DF|nr:zinc-dependent metalloprotease [Flavobacterium croceum]
MKLKLLFSILFIQVAVAQPTQRNCGMEQKMQQIMSNPIERQRYLDIQAKFEKEYNRLLSQSVYSKNSAASPAATIVIPVAVHFPSVSSTASAADKDCLRALAQSQINVINADYNAANADLSNWTGGVNALYPGITVGNMNIQFQIATQNHPAGTGIPNGTVAVTFGTDFLNGADSDTTWAGYMNFVVRDEGATTLGYSPLAGSPSAGHTVVMNTFCFGSGSGCSSTGYQPASPFDLGRTVTHELGHFFNLDHTFAGCSTSSNCSTAGDKVCDTPASSAESYGCPTPGSVLQCNGTKVLTMNYMDYVDDACMYMFTSGQATRMLAYYNVIKTQYLTNVLGNTEFLSNNFSITPNPSKGDIVITLKSETPNYSIEIFDISAKTIYQENFKNTSGLVQNVSIPNAQTGIYFVNITTPEGIITKKLLIE